jgi:uncharacterized protein (TIGR03067 family)
MWMLMYGMLVVQAAQQADLHKLQGTWQVVAFAMGDERHSFDGDAGQQWIITVCGNRWLNPDAAKDGDDVTFALNLFATPRQIDFRFTRWGSLSAADARFPVTCPGIYALDGDNLTVCYDMPFALHGKSLEASRPKDFRGKPGLLALTLTLKRTKP